ncbi:hypothetical protein CO044_00525 [Candidatus Peregrinibacteria bacterium CG_4_9_14_0_2_um_filter_38_9]|nr:MAG: hypothetical protein CO044_00525 [Candidatus Peregrinibacteria bacterium CG_4_9_14_0_2_um_filter_38_9]
MKTCEKCQNQFTIPEDDKNFLQKFSVKIEGATFAVPEPTLCPDCRQQRRLSFRNERALYHRKCDMSSKDIISIYRQDSPYKVYSPQEWWSDKWNPLDFGRDFDFERPFFEQFAELKQSIPHLSLHVTNNESSEYINLSGYNKHCHLIFAAEYNEDCLYGTQVIKSESCLDTLNCLESKYCYEVVDVQGCYQLLYSQDCKNCNESMFLYNCRNCSNCLFSSNLRNKQYYIFNQPYSKEQFLSKKAEIAKQLSEGKLDSLREQFVKLKFNTIHKDLSMTNCENSLGNFLSNCKNAQLCFDLAYGEDCRFVYTGYQVKDIMDVCHTTEMELSYEGMSVGYKSYNVLFANGAWSTNNALYVDNVHSCQNVFGCSNLRNGQYCILNKQYAKPEYEKMVAKIIEHMQKTGEWGQYFPLEMSPFKYEDTVANEYFPHTEKETKYQGEIPPNSIICEITGRPFNLVDAEKEFYKSMNLSIPKRHPDQRHKERLALRPARKLVKKQCDKCSIEITTPFTAKDAQKVYCEKCYLQEVY